MEFKLGNLICEMGKKFLDFGILMDMKFLLQ